MYNSMRRSYLFSMNVSVKLPSPRQKAKTAFKF